MSFQVKNRHNFWPLRKNESGAQSGHASMIGTGSNRIK